MKKIQQELKTPNNLFVMPLLKLLAIKPINTTLPHVKNKVEWKPIIKSDNIKQVNTTVIKFAPKMIGI